MHCHRLNCSMDFGILQHIRSVQLNDFDIIFDSYSKHATLNSNTFQSWSQKLKHSTSVGC